MQAPARSRAYHGHRLRCLSSEAEPWGHFQRSKPSKCQQADIADGMCLRGAPMPIRPDIDMLAAVLACPILFCGSYFLLHQTMVTPMQTTAIPIQRLRLM